MRVIAPDREKGKHHPGSELQSVTRPRLVNGINGKYHESCDTLQLKMRCWALVFLLASCWAQWATFYSFTLGKVYMKLKNDDIVPLNFSITGFDNLDEYSSYTKSELDLQTGQSISPILQPPTNSTVFLHESSLYAFRASDQESSYDVCGDGIFQLLKYDSDANEWESANDNMTFTDVSDISYYIGSTIMTSPNSDYIYIYGGKCPSSGAVTDRLLSFNMKSFSFTNITTSTKPHGFFGASTQWAPNPQNSLVVGGKSNDGWLNMYQLATWNYDSGWSFQTVKKNNSLNINSRINPLLLPVFSLLSDNSTLTFVNDYRPSSLILIGGNGSSCNASPEWAKLNVNLNTWTWESMSSSVDVDDLLGAAVLFDTLVVIKKSSTSKRSSSSYTVLLYDVSDGLTLVKSLSSNTSTSKTSSSSSISTTVKALVGTFVPLAAIALAAVAGFYLWKKKQTGEQERESVLDVLDYQLGHFRTRSDIPTDVPHPEFHRRLSGSSESTLEAASIDSWVKKRQEFDASRLQTVRRHSFSGLNETLNSVPEVVDDEDTETPTLPEMEQTSLRPILPARVRQIRKSFSFTNTPPSLPNMKKASLKGGYIGLNDQPSPEDEENENSCDEEMDVQVLVSSKRKSVLRVVNPDDGVDDEDSIRQRTPST